jgi:prepilin-type N-terminal cleavage/methylation domain-containing protein
LLRVRACAQARGGPGGPAGFTLLEILLAVSILSMVSAVTYLAFSTVTEAWRRGMALSDSLSHGDFVIEQLVMALRSSYYPEVAGAGSDFGFVQEDGGFGDQAIDRISWVKLGGSLVGRSCPFAGSPHRVVFTLEEDEEGRLAVAVRAWRVHGQPEDFDPETVEPIFLSGRVTGFDCRTAFEKDGEDFDWLDAWEETNKIPRVVEVSLFMEPLGKGEPPVELKRLVQIPASGLCWR